MTNFVKQTFTWFVDMGTDPTNMQIIRVTAGGNMVRQRLLPFFTAFKYYKLGAVRLRFVPAATLPVDPTGLSYEAGENTVDPRDQFNPGLVRITNGEDWFADSVDTTGVVAEQMYYNMMLDNRWFKFQLQSGMRRTAFPLFWSVGQLHQDKFPGATRNIPVYTDNGQIAMASVSESAIRANADSPFEPDLRYNLDDSSPYGLFQTGAKERMGWMPTDYMQTVPMDPGSLVLWSNKVGIIDVPEVELMRIVLPKAYKTKYYYRVYIEEEVMFKDPVVVQYNGRAMPDRFIRPAYEARLPGSLMVKKPDNVLLNDGSGDLPPYESD